jgi:hypothetical protein
MRHATQGACVAGELRGQMQTLLRALAAAAAAPPPLREQCAPYQVQHTPALLTLPSVPLLCVLQALRLTLVQVLMNSKGYNMNPMQSLYYVSPACLLCLIVPFCEWRLAGAPVASGV